MSIQYRICVPRSSGDGLTTQIRRKFRLSGVIASAGQSTDFVDMLGQELAGVRVVARLANASGSAVWKCGFVDCEHTQPVFGTALRQRHKEGKRVRCRVCKKARGKV